MDFETMGAEGPDGLLLAAQEQVQLPAQWQPGAIEARLDLRVRLDSDEARKLGQKLAREYGYFEDALSDRRENATDWRDDAVVMPKEPLLGSRSNEQDQAQWMSRTRGSLTSVACRSATQKLIQQILTPKPPFVAEAKQQTFEINGMPVDLVQEAPRVEEAWACRWSEAGAREAYRDLFEEIAVAGPAAMKVSWEKETIFVPERTVPQDEEQLQLLLESGQVDPREAWMESFSTDEQDRPNARIEWREKVVREGVRFTPIPFEELVFLPAGAKYPSDAFAIGERVRLRGDFLRERCRDRRSGYFTEACEQLLKQASDPLSETEQMRQDRVAINADVPTADDDENEREYACIRLAFLGKLGRDRGKRWYWLTFHPPTQSLLCAAYVLDRHGLCPYTIYNYLGGKLIGMSLAELNAVEQDYYTTTKASIHDLTAILVGAAGSFLVDVEQSGFDANEATLTPGRAWPCRNPAQTIVPLPIAQNIPAALGVLVQVLELSKQESQLLTSTSNVSLGKEADEQTTATEIRTVHAVDNAISEIIGHGIALRVAEDLEKFRQLEAQYATQGQLPYTSQGMAPGPDGQPQMQVQHSFIPPELLAAPYRIIPAGLSASSSAEARYQKAALVGQLVQTNPLTMNVPEIQFDQLEAQLEAIGEPQAKKWLSIAKLAYAEIVRQQAEMQGGAMDAQADEQRRAEEAHGSEMQGNALGQLGQVKELMAPPEKAKANGARK